MIEQVKPPDMLAYVEGVLYIKVWCPNGNLYHNLTLEEAIVLNIALEQTIKVCKEA